MAEIAEFAVSESLAAAIHMFFIEENFSADRELQNITRL